MFYREILELYYIYIILEYEQYYFITMLLQTIITIYFTFKLISKIGLLDFYLLKYLNFY